MLEMRGIPAAPGVAIGRAYVLNRSYLVGSQYEISEEEVEVELARFERAVKAAQRQLKSVLRRLQSVGAGEEHTFILEAHLLMLQDPELIDGVTTRISVQHMNAEWALRECLRQFKDALSQIDNEYFQERGNDIDQVGQRLLRNLIGDQGESLSHMPSRSIVVAHDLTPADTVCMLKGQVKGFVTELGGRTSHIAILARSMVIPALVGVEGITQEVSTGDQLIVDGQLGVVIIRPTEDVLRRYRAKRRRVQRHRKNLAGNRDLKAETRDGHEVVLRANIEKMNELDVLGEYGARGVGLFRTEYLFLDRQNLPDEEEQYRVYRELVERTQPHAAVIRTLDLGADKQLLGEGETALDKHLSPALGLRGIRYCLRHPEIFEPQLRALLRAACHGSLKIMVPMISGLEEVRAVKAVVERCRGQLRSAGYAIPDDIPLGIMVETPAAALLAAMLAREVDFFSIGTNDLAHYTIAVDRMDERLAYLYQPLHPAVLRLIREVIRTGEAEGIEVGLCGEMAGDPLHALVLLGFGLKYFSMSPLFIPAVKHVIRNVSFEEAKKNAEACVEFQTSSDVREWLLERYRKLFS